MCGIDCTGVQTSLCQDGSCGCAPDEVVAVKEPAIWKTRKLALIIPPQPETDKFLQLLDNLAYSQALKSDFFRSIYFVQLQEHKKAIFSELKKKFEYSRSAATPQEVNARFPYILCPQDTAVIVEDRFLHANYVNNGEKSRTFVASQSPSRFPLFWQFICATTSHIIDLDMSENVCYPSVLDEERTFKDISVKLLQLEQTEDEATYEYLVEDKAAKKSRLVTRYHLNDTTEMTVAKMKYLVQKLHTLFTGNTLVHCGTGVGPTCTVIAAYFLTQRIREGKVRVADLGNTILDLLDGIMKQRSPDAVQTRDRVDLLFDLGLDLLLHPADEIPRMSQEQQKVDTRYAVRPHLPARVVKVEDQFFHVSSVNVSDGCRTFVAYQSPVNFLSFWQFISDHPAYNNVIDLDTDENWCYPPTPEDYWEVKDISVKLLQSEQIEGGTESKYLVEDHLTRKSQLITRWHYKAWDTSTPLDLAQLKELVQKLDRRFIGKTLVHCKSGVAPIVTVITAHLFKERMSQGESVDIGALYDQVRKQHGSFFIQPPDHIPLLYDFAKEIH